MPRGCHRRWLEKVTQGWVGAGTDGGPGVAEGEERIRTWKRVTEDEGPLPELRDHVYRRCHYAHGPRWVTYEEMSGERWFGLECVGGLQGLPENIVLVPLPGHTRGHTGVAVDTGKGWVLRCGDAYYVQEELRQRGRASPGVRCFRRFAHMDITRARSSLEELKRLFREHGDEVTLVASHDQFAYRAVFGRPLD